MHSPEASASPARRVSVVSQDIVGGRISPNINVATPNLGPDFLNFVRFS